MNSMLRMVLSAVAAAAMATNVSTAHAGQTCEDKPLAMHEITRGMQMAAEVARSLDDSGADVVVLARAGQDLSRYRLDWSHLGFAYKEPTSKGTHVWRVVHKLNHCGAAEGALYRQGLGEFFMDRPHRYAASFVTLTPTAQAALKPVLADNRRAHQFDEPSYNMLAYPRSTQYQQSNQWALETLAGALNPSLNSRQTVQRWLQARGYAGTTLTLGAMTRLGARVGMAHVAFDDHPSGQRFNDRIETVTVESVFEWLQLAGLGGAPKTIRLGMPAPRAPTSGHAP